MDSAEMEIPPDDHGSDRLAEKQQEMLEIQRSFAAEIASRSRNATDAVPAAMEGDAGTGLDNANSGTNDVGVNADQRHDNATIEATTTEANMNQILDHSGDEAGLMSDSDMLALITANAHNAAAAAFKDIQAIYARKKASGAASATDEIEYLQAEAEERLRQERVDAEHDFVRSPSPVLSTQNDESEMFVTLPPTSKDGFSDEELPAPKHRGRKRKAKDSAAPGSSSKRGTRKGKTRGDENEDAEATTDDAPPKRKKSAPKKKANNNISDYSMTNLSNVMSSNVFHDIAATKDLEEQPIIRNTTRKSDFQKQMIAALPNKAILATQVRKLIRATQDFISHSITPSQAGLWTVKGVKTELKHFQVLGVSWMTQREKSSVAPKGGILADEMGLGKTIMMLTTIVNNLPDRPSTGPRATLVVASPALVRQWYEEIAKHIETKAENKLWGIGSVIQHHATSRITANNLGEILMQADIVLTTYQEVLKSYPTVVIPPGITGAAAQEAFWDGHYEENKGIFHKCKFHRVVLDEAHAIKNFKSHTSKACRALDAKHRWALSGTPVQNSAMEWFAYFQFLRDPIAATQELWKENFSTGDDPIGSRRLGVLLSRIMLRRSHLDTIFGCRLVDIPPPQQSTVWLEFNGLERQIYEILKMRFINCINQISLRGQLQKKYSHIFTMLLRLRQICSHPLLVQDSLMDLLERDDFEKLTRLSESAEELHGEQGEMLVHLRRMLAENAEKKQTATFQADSTTITTETEIVSANLSSGDSQYSTEEVGRAHGLEYHFTNVLDAIRKDPGRFESITARTPCYRCKQPPQDPHVTSCSHIYCWDCLNELAHMAARRGYESSRCLCGEQYTETRPCTEALDYIPDPAQPSDTPSLTGKKKSKKTSPAYDWIDMGHMLPSAKTLAIKSQLLNWFAAQPGSKCIIFSQFRPMLKILGRVCQTEGWGYCTYSGDMSHDARQNSIADFKANAEKKILLCGFKAGGVGLNLTMANLVLCTDVYWHQSGEQQAFCRVLRLGQDKTSYMTRLVIRNSIDEAMINLQERKQKDIDSLMGYSKEKLSVVEIMSLFGEVRNDANGRPFIFPDNTKGSSVYQPDFYRCDEEES